MKEELWVGFDDSRLQEALGLGEVEARALRERGALLQQFTRYVNGQRLTFDMSSSFQFCASKASESYRHMDLSFDDGDSTIAVQIDAVTILNLGLEHLIYTIVEEIVEKHITDDEEDDESNFAQKINTRLSVLYEDFLENRKVS